MTRLVAPLPRRRLCGLVLLTGGLLTSGASGAEYDASSPKAAFRSYTKALAAADVEGIKTLVIASPKHVQMLQALAEYGPVEKKFRAAVIKAFPTAAKDLPDPNEATLKSIDSAEAKITGDSATVQTRDSVDVVQLKKEGARWKVDITSMFPADTVDDVILYRKAMAEVMETTGEDIAAGKFKSWEDVQKDLAVRVKMRLAMPPSPDDPTTRPGL